MKMLIFTQCCCGCSVRTGSLIIGVLFTILSLTEFAIEEFQINSTVPANEKNDAYVPLWFITVEAVTNLIATLVNLSMLFGILTERLTFVLVWIIFYAAYSVFIIVAMINSLIVLPSHVSLWLIPFYLLGSDCVLCPCGQQSLSQSARRNLHSPQTACCSSRMRKHRNPKAVSAFTIINNSPNHHLKKRRLAMLVKCSIHFGLSKFVVITFKTYEHIILL